MRMEKNNQILLQFENYLAQLPLPEEPKLLYAPIEYSLSEGGKRLRPLLLLLSCQAFSGGYKQAMDAAAAVEVFHNFTLLHDDIMDHSDLRRGKPSVVARWGENVAILSGDAMLITAYRLLSNVPHHLLGRIMEIFNDMAVGVCEGQQYDMDFEERQKVSVVEYMRMIELKTSVLLAGSAMIGALIGGSTEEEASKLYKFALELGMAFQLQDDLLDSYGDERLGKPIGGDILEGKKSYLMITAMSHANDQEREILRSTHLNNKLTAEEKIALVKSIYNKLEIPRLVEQQISLRFDRAQQVLESLNLSEERIAGLKEFATSLMGRQK